MIPACELALLLFAALFLIRGMENISPLELLHEQTAYLGATEKGKRKYTESDCDAPKEFNIKELQLGGSKTPSKKKYGGVCHVGAYILRHIRRGIGKTALSIILTIVLTVGIGVLALTRLSYQEAFYETEVNGRALDFSSSAVAELSKSDLIRNLYYYSNFNVRVESTGVRSLMTITNNFEHYFGNSCTVAYADGYDSSVFSGTGQVCLLGQTLAKELKISPGDEISLISDDLYTFMEELYENGDEILNAAAKASKEYKVVGIVAGKEDVSNNIFTVANGAAEALENIRYIRDLLESFLPMAVAAVQVTRYKIMELLQAKE